MSAEQISETAGPSVSKLRRQFATFRKRRLVDAIWRHQQEIGFLALHRRARMSPSGHRRLERDIRRLEQRLTALRQRAERASMRGQT